MAKLYDLVSFSYEGKRVFGVLVQLLKGQGPDYLIWTQKRAGTNESRLARTFVESTRLEGAIIDGKQYLSHEQAALRAELETEARSTYGKKAIQEYRMRPSPTDPMLPMRSQHHENLDVFGGLSSYQPPWELTRDANPETVTQLDRFVAVRDPGADRETLTRDSYEVRYLDRLKEMNEAYWRAYTAVVVDGRNARDLANREDITLDAAYQRVHRAREAYEKVAREAQS